MDFLEQQYLMLISSRLLGFTQKDTYLYNFRCPFCGDSTKNKHKKRGFIFVKDNTTLFKCHNCGEIQSFDTFLKNIDNNLHQEFKLEKFKLSAGYKPKKQSKDKLLTEQLKNIENSVKNNDSRLKKNYLRKCITLSKITPENDLYAVKQYCLDRFLPEIYFDDIYACKDITDISSLIPKYQDKCFMNESMFMVVPFYKKNGHYDYLQCRTIDKDCPDYMRFVTFETNENSIKLWGEKYIDWSKPIRVLEGVIDALFVDNSLALAGASVNKALEYITAKQQQQSVNGKVNKPNIVICLDTDYKENPQVLDILKKRIKEGYSVLIYDKKFDKKDMNDIIMKSKWSIKDLNLYIEKRTFVGFRATLELSQQGIK